MARRKKNYDFFKKLRSKFKVSKRTRQKLMTLGVVAVMIFAFWVYHTSKIQTPKSKLQNKKAVSAQKTPVKAPAPAKKVSSASKPAVQDAVVYYKKTPVKTAAPVSLPPVRPLTGAPKIVFVIDDIGNTSAHVPEIEKLGRDVTYAILPLLPHTAFFDQLSLRTGAEVILHLPLESYKGTIPGPGLITNNMTDDRILEELNRNLNSVPHRIGVNNHMGSKGTSDPRVMDVILSELKDRGMFFLDSGTTRQTAAPVVAQELGMTILRRDEFLDNVDEPSAIRAEVRKLAETARRKGYAVGIGHYRLNTLRVLQEEIPLLKQAGFQIVSLRELLYYKKNSRG